MKKFLLLYIITNYSSSRLLMPGGSWVLALWIMRASRAFLKESRSCRPTIFTIWSRINLKLLTQECRRIIKTLEEQLAVKKELWRKNSSIYKSLECSCCESRGQLCGWCQLLVKASGYCTRLYYVSYISFKTLFTKIIGVRRTHCG